MCTFIYLLFGLALTSMCINVVQEKLSSTFEKAKLMAAASMGLDPNQIVADEIRAEREKSKSHDSSLDKSQTGSEDGKNSFKLKDPSTSAFKERRERRKSPNLETIPSESSSKKLPPTNKTTKTSAV